MSFLCFSLVFSLWFYVKFVFGDISPPPSFKVTAHLALRSTSSSGRGPGYRPPRKSGKKDATQATVSLHVKELSKTLQKTSLHEEQYKYNVTSIEKSDSGLGTWKKSTSYHTARKHVISITIHICYLIII